MGNTLAMSCHCRPPATALWGRGCGRPAGAMPSVAPVELGNEQFVSSCVVNERPKHDGNHMPPPDLHCRHIGAHNMESDLCFLQLMRRASGATVANSKYS